MDQANHDYLFWNTFALRTTPFLDWVISGIFYEALHWIEAFLATKGQHSVTHATRWSVMRHYRTELQPILFHFDTLKNDSENARYRCYKHTQHDVQADIVPRLEAIKRHIQQLI